MKPDTSPRALGLPNLATAFLIGATVFCGCSSVTTKRGGENIPDWLTESPGFTSYEKNDPLNGKPRDFINGMPPEGIYIDEYLAVMGARFDCFITKEKNSAMVRDLDHPETWPQLVRATYIRNDRPIEGVDDLVRVLKVNLSECAVFRNTSNTKIIHLVDKSLLNNTHYQLGRRITLKYQGLLGGLPKAIGTQQPGVESPRGFTIPQQYIEDGSPHVKVKAITMPIRELLTRAVPLSPHPRHKAENVSVTEPNNRDAYYVRTPTRYSVLWVAETVLRDGLTTTEIHFPLR